MAGSTLVTFDALIKERYEDPSIVEELIYPENPLLGMLKKNGDTDMVGDVRPVPIMYGNPQGVGGSFTVAQTNNSTTKSAKFAIEAGDYFGTVRNGEKVLMATRTNQGAFLENKRTEIDGLWETAGENLSIYCWGNGGNALGQIGSISGNIVTLADTAQIANFEQDMYVVASANDGATSTDALRDSADQTIITAVNRNTGVLTLTTGDISGMIAGDYLFREGDFFGDTGTVVIKGIQSFITATDAPPALWGVSAATRATDPQRFAGCRVPTAELAGKTYEERIKTLISRMKGRYKAKMPTAGFMHPEDFDVLQTLMAARGQRDLNKSETQFGYASVSVAVAGGNLPIYTDRHCPKGTFFAFRMEDFWISSMGEMLYPQTGDSLQILRVYNSTDYEYRLISHPLLACRAPKNSGRVPLSS
jgi:hypothetical protein